MTVCSGRLAQFGPFLDADLLNYGYALLTSGLELLEELEADGDEEDEATSQAEVARLAFIQGSYALEAATRNAADAPDQAATDSSPVRAAISADTPPVRSR